MAWSWASITSDVSAPSRTYDSCGPIARQGCDDAGTMVTIYPSGENEPGVGSCLVTPECSPIVPRFLRVDVPDPVAEDGPVKGKSTERSDDEDREQRPYHCRDL